MEGQQIALGLVNVAGGLLVIGSYVWGVRTHPANRGAIWGGVPEGLKPWYTVSMLSAAAGYFAFTYFILFSIEPGDVGFGFGTFIAFYALVLLPSALWMPLTYDMLQRPSRSLWWAIRITLAVVGLSSLGLLGGLLALGPGDSAVVFGLAVAGAVAFCVQTALLDALVWPLYFPTKR